MFTLAKHGMVRYCTVRPGTTPVHVYTRIQNRSSNEKLRLIPSIITIGFWVLWARFYHVSHLKWTRTFCVFSRRFSSSLLSSSSSFQNSSRRRREQAHRRLRQFRQRQSRRKAILLLMLSVLVLSRLKPSPLLRLYVKRIWLPL